MNRSEHDALHRESNGGCGAILGILLIAAVVWLGIFVALDQVQALDCRLFALEKNIETRMTQRDSPQDWLSAGVCYVHTLDGEVPLNEYRSR